MSEDYYPPVDMWAQPNYSNMKPVVQLQCEDGYKIESIEFASYGTPQGTCQAFSTGNCHATNSSAILSKVSIEKKNRSIIVTS